MCVFYFFLNKFILSRHVRWLVATCFSCECLWQSVTLLAVFLFYKEQWSVKESAYFSFSISCARPLFFFSTAILICLNSSGLGYVLGLFRFMRWFMRNLLSKTFVNHMNYYYYELFSANYSSTCSFESELDRLTYIWFVHRMMNCTG